MAKIKQRREVVGSNESEAGVSEEPPPSECAAAAEKSDGSKLIALDDLGDWQTRFGFVNETDRLFTEFQPPEKPRIPTEQDMLESWRDKLLPNSVRDLFIHSFVAGS